MQQLLRWPGDCCAAGMIEAQPPQEARRIVLELRIFWVVRAAVATVTLGLVTACLMRLFEWLAALLPGVVPVGP